MGLPQFNPRYFEQILQDMVNFVRTVAPMLTDFNIGSLIRTILEAAAMEDDEQYNQMVALLLLWNLDNIRGRDLDERLLEWNVFRFPSLSSAGEVIVSNDNLTQSFLQVAAPTGTTLLQLYSTEGYPTSGYPYSARMAEKGANEEDVSVTNNNVALGQLTLAAGCLNDHSVNERVGLIEGGSNTAPAGSRIRVRSNPLSPEITATLMEDAVVAPGDYDSDPVLAIVDSGGTIGNVGAGAFEDFVGSPPFDGALVRNNSRFSGGLDEESDDQFRDRGRKKLQALARGTPLALEQLVIGTEYTEINGRTWRVVSASIREYFGQGILDKVDLYVWPGAFDFVKSQIIPAPEDLTPITGAEDGQRFFKLVHLAVVPNSLRLQLYPVGGTGWQNLTRDVDYFFNEGTGWLRIADPGLNAGDKIRAFTYSYYTDLLQKVQVVINGATRNPLEYPGIRAAGVRVLATFPRPLKINPIRVAIQVKDGFVEEDVAPLVRDAINRYLVELKTGEDVVFHEMAERAMAVDGMYDLQFSYPTSNIVVPEDGILDLEDLNILVS